MSSITLGTLDGCFDSSQFDINLTGFKTNRGMRYEGILVHKGLMKSRSITSTDQDVLKQKVFAQVHVWDEMWKKRVAKEKAARKKEQARMDKEQKKELSIERTEEAQQALESIRKTLAHTLTIDDTIDWNSLKDQSGFKKPQPVKQNPPAPPVPQNMPTEPQTTDDEFKPRLNPFDYLIGSRKQKKLDERKENFDSAHSGWEQACNKLTQENAKAQVEHESLVKKMKGEYSRALAEWEKEKQDFLENQQQANAAVDHRREQYNQKLPEAIVDYCDMVLSNSNYPDSFLKQWEMDFNPENGILILDYQLPSIEDLPRIKEVKYVQLKDVFNEVRISDAELNRTYDELLYQIALRTTHELYEADVIEALQSVVFNGWVKTIDKATGNEITPCILTLQANRTEFLAINLERVGAKACFKSLKGVSSSKLSSLAPVAPLLQINREDRRFVDGYAVADGIIEGDNIAAMDWEDFEHLIRELFEKEFAKAGEEVRVTQASRDGGVDAVIFDPDPLRGGKIVIQAKRYTNTVSVSAVRDLYGTVVNEGAIKGILVSTADYGPDAYEFAKGKPLTLLSGNNLLHMLERHGHKARIDLKEAKKIIEEQKR